MELREQISKQEERFAKLIDDKNLEIQQLNLKIQEYLKKEPPITLEKLLNNTNNNTNSPDELSLFAERVKSNPEELKQYDNIIDYIQQNYSPVNKTDVTSKFLALLESYDIISPKQNGIYTVTETGKRFYRLLHSLN